MGTGRFRPGTSSTGAGSMVVSWFSAIVLLPTINQSGCTRGGTEHQQFLEGGDPQAFAVIVRHIQYIVGQKRGIGGLAIHDFAEFDGNLVLVSGGFPAIDVGLLP